MRYVPIFLLLLACPRGGDTTPADDEPIRVRLERPEHVNRRYRVRTRAVNQQVEQLAGADGQPQERQVRIVATLSGEVQVVALNDDGTQKELQVTVESFAVEANGQNQEPLPTGTVVRVVRGEPSRILIEGEDVSGQLGEVLGLVLPDGPDRNEDEVFGTESVQQVGGSWPINPDTTAAMMRAMRLQADDAAIDGTMTLATRDETSYRVEGHLNVSSMRMPGLPPNTTLDSANLTTRFEWTLPLDEDAHATESLTEMQMNVRMQLQDEEGREAMLTMRTNNRRTTELEPLPDGEPLEESPPPPPRTSNFGTIELAAGFTPDPHRARGTSGGPVSASTLDESCAGYISDLPDHLLEVEGGFETLRVMVHSPADVTLVVQHPDGSVHCSDDDEGTDPIVEVALAEGEHRIFVGAKEEGGTSPYVLGLTELPAVMPSTLLTEDGRPEEEGADDDDSDEDSDDDDDSVEE